MSATVSMPIVGAVMMAAAGLITIWRVDAVARRRFRCDGCRAEELGSSMPFLTHTCSRRRAFYRDRRGRAFAFGERSWEPSRRKG